MTSGLLPFLVVLAGLLGLVIGSFLNVVVYRVPAGISLMRESRCPHCDAPVRWWQNVPVVSWIALRGKCANCHAPISARYPLVEAVTGVAFAVITWWILEPSTGAVTGWMVTGNGSGVGLGDTGLAASLVVLVAYLYFAAISIGLTLIDLDTHRLPNSIVLPSYVVALVLFTVACLFGADWWALGRAAIGGAALFAFYFIIRLISPKGMGGGDVKLAGVVGLHLAWLGWSTLVVGAFAAFVLGGVFGIILLATRRAGRRTAIPFGPWMIIGAWTGIFTGEMVGRIYGGLYVS